MRNILLLIPVLFAFLFKASSEIPGQVITGQSGVTFKMSHLSGTVTGTFSGMQGTVNFDENNLGISTMDVKIDANSIDTKNKKRDSDLRGKKFFDVEKYPHIHFKSKEISRTADGFQVRGDLTIKDQTHEETIPFKVDKKEGGEVFSGSFTVNRKLYNLGINSFPPIGKTADVSITAVVK